MTNTQVISKTRNTPPSIIVPIDEELRLVIKTNLAAYHLSMSPQTLRYWAMSETGPIKPVRIGNRLLWRVADLKALLNGGLQ